MKKQMDTASISEVVARWHGGERIVNVFGLLKQLIVRNIDDS